jgi:RNA polymerase sigma factor (sigma-70 family)
MRHQKIIEKTLQHLLKVLQTCMPTSGAKSLLMSHKKPTEREGASGCADKSSFESGHAKASPLSPVTVAFVECRNFLSKYLRGLLPAQQDIEDVTQEAYLRAWIAEQSETIEQPKAFLFRIAKNLALNKLSKKSRLITDYIGQAGAMFGIETGAAIDEELEAEQRLGLYCEAIAALPDKQRQVFLLRKLHGMAHKEIADRLDVSKSSVEKYLREGILACEQHIRYHEAPMAPIETVAVRKVGKVRS